MLQITQTEFSNNTPEIIKQVEVEPVALTRYSIPISVVISYDVYKVTKDFIENAYKHYK